MAHGISFIVDNTGLKNRAWTHDLHGLSALPPPPPLQPSWTHPCCPTSSSRTAAGLLGPEADALSCIEECRRGEGRSGRRGESEPRRFQATHDHPSFSPRMGGHEDGRNLSAILLRVCGSSSSVGFVGEDEYGASCGINSLGEERL